MITLTDEDIIKFQEIYKNYTGENISEAEAREQGIKLIRLLKIIYESSENNENKIITN